MTKMRTNDDERVDVSRQINKPQAGKQSNTMSMTSEKVQLGTQQEQQIQEENKSAESCHL